MEQFLQEYVLPNLWGALVGVIGSLWLWIKGKPKEQIEKDGGIVDNAKKVLEMSEDIAERLEKQLLQSDEVITQLKEKLRIELEETNNCRKALRAIKIELAEWKRVADEQKIELEALREECRLLRLAIQQNEKDNPISDDLHLN